MKLKELVYKILESEAKRSDEKRKQFDFSKDGIVTWDVLAAHKDELLQCDEFKELTELSFMEMPIIEIVYVSPFAMN